MITYDLKLSILKSAFSGKLSNTLSSDYDIDKLMEEINKKHNDLIDKKVVKKDSKVNPVVESEYPFQIPDSWRWSKFYYVLDVRDGTHDSPKYHNEGVPLVTSKNLNSNGLLDMNNIKFISEEDAVIINNRSKVDKGDILFAMIGSIGKPVLIVEEPEFCIKNMALFKNPVKNFLDNQYLYLYLLFSQERMKNESSGGVQQFVSLNYLRNFYIPIPPIEEQKRIVNKIEELFSKIDSIYPIEEELKLLKREFPIDMKKSILKFAFSGEMSNEKPKMMNLEECLINIACKEYQIKQSDIKKVGKYPVVSQSKDIIEGYYDNELKLFKHNKPVLVYGDHSNSIKYVDFDFVIGADGTKIFEAKDMFDVRYLYYNILFNLNFIPCNGYSRHYKYLKELPISYFPINIQKSIVNIIEKLFPLCDDLDNIIRGN